MGETKAAQCSDAIWRAVKAGVLHGWTERAQLDSNRGGVANYEAAVACAESYATMYANRCDLRSRIDAEECAAKP